MNSDKRTCQNCKLDFTIEPDDFLFYEKIKVPPPTFCPECRMIRRMAWRNVRSLYKRECGLCNKSLISMYPDDGAPVYCTECWNGNKWNQYEIGIDYDFNEKFFTQWYKLLKKAPRSYTYKSGNIINSDFSNYVVDDKNVYLSYSVVGCEDIMYSEVIDNSKNSYDCYGVLKIDNCSYNVDCEGNYNTHYAIKSRNCIDSFFIYDCTNCQNCFLSSNLRNKKYFYKDEQLSKEEYEKIILKAELNKYSKILQLNKEFEDIIKTKTLHRFAQIYNSQNTTGDYIHNAKNTKQCFDAYDTENVAYCVRSFITKENYDTQGSSVNSEFVYESIAASLGTFKDYFCYIALSSRECEYCFIMKNCKSCFGCFGLTNAQYCILNKQYKKEEYFDTIKKIKQQMSELPYVDKKGRVYKYGEFFPYEMSPFGYNETNAHDFFTLTKDEALEKGYNWKDKEKRNYDITMQSENLPDNILDVEDSILNEIIRCPNNGNQIYQCTSAYRIMSEELQFYRQKNLPLPRYCPNCRHYQRLKYRNPMKLWHRKCMKKGCTNEFETSYAPERPEIVYCEQCYQKEVY